MLCCRSGTRRGPVDWLINNAGVSQRALVLETLLEVDRQIMAAIHLVLAGRAGLPGGQWG